MPKKKNKPKLVTKYSLEEMQDSCTILQAFSLLARTNQKESAQAALKAFDRFKLRYYKYKPLEPEYDGSEGTIQLNSKK